MSDYILYPNPDQTLTAGAFRYALVAARFNQAVVDKLLHAAVSTLKEHGAGDEQIEVFRVPGAFEIPLICQRLAQSRQYDAILALGCVIRGETPHFDYVCRESARGVMEVSLKFDLPVINAILTTDDARQAEARAGESGPNKGRDAAQAAMEMLALLKNQGRP